MTIGKCTREAAEFWILREILVRRDDLACNSSITSQALSKSHGLDSGTGDCYSTG